MPAKTLTIFLHDYAGHPFQAELSRALAARGHKVIHAFFAGDPGPKGDLTWRHGDPETLQFLPVGIDEPFTKANFIKRRFQDLKYGRAVAAEINRIRPDIVFSGNTPTEAQERVQAAAKAAGARFVFWWQDIFSIAASKLLTKKLPVVGALVGEYYLALERRQTRNSDANLVISEDFSSILLGWGAARAQMHVIPNWGAIDQIAVQPKDNAWARAHGVADKKVILYSGTIGLKHDPMKLVALAEEFRADPSVVIVVVAAGTGVAALQTAKQERNLDNLMLLGLQAFKDLPEVMGAADVLAAMIEPDAGQFSVPSKVNSYLCARRPILLASPQENLAARIVSTSGAGLTVDSRDNAGWIAAAKALMGDADLRKKLADSGRAYAEDNFDIGRVTDRFEAVIASAMGGGQAPPAQTHAPNAPLERNQTYA